MGKLQLFDSEYVAELEWALNQEMSENDPMDLPKLWAEYQKEAADPTWRTDTTYAMPNFHDWITG